MKPSNVINFSSLNPKTALHIMLKLNRIEITKFQQTFQEK